MLLAAPGLSGGGGGGGDSPKPASSRYRARLEAARAFCCDVCSASFVREDSLRSHRKQHRDAQAVLHLQLAPSQPATQHPVAVVPLATQQQQQQQSGARLELPVSPDAMTPYGSAQLKIIVSQPVGADGGDGGENGTVTPLDQLLR